MSSFLRRKSNWRRPELLGISEPGQKKKTTVLFYTKRSSLSRSVCSCLSNTPPRCGVLGLGDKGPVGSARRLSAASKGLELFPRRRERLAQDCNAHTPRVRSQLNPWTFQPNEPATPFVELSYFVLSSMMSS